MDDGSCWEEVVIHKVDVARIRLRADAAAQTIDRIVSKRAAEMAEYDEQSAVRPRACQGVRIQRTVHSEEARCEASLVRTGFVSIRCRGFSDTGTHPGGWTEGLNFLIDASDVRQLDQDELFKDTEAEDAFAHLVWESASATCGEADNRLSPTPEMFEALWQIAAITFAPEGIVVRHREPCGHGDRVTTIDYALSRRFLRSDVAARVSASER